MQHHLAACSESSFLFAPSFFPFPVLLGRLRQQECEAALCFFLRGCWGVSARPLTPAAGPLVQARKGWTTILCTNTTMQHTGDCCFSNSQRGEEPLPGAPVRHDRPFLCQPLMATRWRVKREEEGSYQIYFFSTTRSFDLLPFVLFIGF